MALSQVRGPGYKHQLCKCQLQALLHSHGCQHLLDFGRKLILFRCMWYSLRSPRRSFQRRQLPFRTLLPCCLFSVATDLCIRQPLLRPNIDHGASSYACNRCGQREEPALFRVLWNRILPATVQVTPQRCIIAMCLHTGTMAANLRTILGIEDSSKSKWSISQC